ncbi:hypothetical protein [Arthrobacter sp. UM1]|uniref:hypothetical protein n=1 Tax=Arthrobacter sp. UM1 TaxID=2766776 RepID=UPI001CF62ECF|nr:hypothetical protein [Arthrobacter sp. UM1]MCB4208668.1 hypothetical protein [Arthrobacter sp. UM1]
MDQDAGRTRGTWARAWRKTREARAVRREQERRAPGGYALQLSAFWARLVYVITGVVALFEGIRLLGGGPLQVRVSRTDGGALPDLPGFTQTDAVSTLEWQEPPALAVGFEWATLVIVAASVIAPALAYLAFAKDVRQGRPFSTGFRRFAHILAMAVLAGGYLPPLLGAFQSALAISAWDAAAAASAEKKPGLTDVQGHLTFFAELPVWPVAVALGAFVLVRVFEHGRRLQEDTEGLV